MRYFSILVYSAQQNTTNTINATGDYNRIAQAGRDVDMSDTIHGDRVQGDQIQGDQIHGDQIRIYNQYGTIRQPHQQIPTTGKIKIKA